MELTNDIVLRPRFSITSSEDPEKLLTKLTSAGEASNNFLLSRVDDHVFIRVPKNKQHFWSPQLHLEIYKIEERPTIIKGLYGPSPKVWTLFMFLHFIVGTLFIGTTIWLYTNLKLGHPFLLQMVALIVLFLVWFVLYFSGRMGKKTGKKEMLALQKFFYDAIQ